MARSRRLRKNSPSFVQAAQVSMLETLEPRLLLSSSIWDGGGDHTSWGDARNWSGDFLPASGDDVTISAGTPDVHIVSGDGTIAIHNLILSGTLTVSGATFTADGNFSADWSSLTADNNGQIAFTSATSLTRINVSAVTGGHILFPAVTSYTSNTWGLDILSDGASSWIDLAHLTTFVGAPSTPTTSITATNGGRIDLAGAFSGHTTWTLDATGVLGVAGVTQIGGVAMNVTGQDLSFPAAASLANSAISAVASTLSFPEVTALTHVSLSAASAGQILFPIATSYVNDDYIYLDILSDGASSWIDLSHLTTFVGSPGNPSTSIAATNGGRIDMAGAFSGYTTWTLDATGGVLGVDGVTQISHATINVTGNTLSFGAVTTLTYVNLSAAAGGQILFPSATSYTSNTWGLDLLCDGASSQIDLSHLTTFVGAPSTPTTAITATNGGRIDLAGAFTSHTTITADGATSILNLVPGTSVTNTDFVAQNGYVVHFGPGGSAFHGIKWSGGGNTLTTMAGTGSSVVVDTGGDISVNGGSLTVVTDNFTNNGILSASGSGTLDIRTNVPMTGSGWIAGGIGSGTIAIKGDLSGNTTNHGTYAPNSTVRFDGAGSGATPQHLEAMSHDLGATHAGMMNNFVYGTLALGGSTYVQLVNSSDNDGAAGNAEAVYTKTLVVPTGTALDLNGLNLYAMTSQISGAIRNGSVTTIADQSPTVSDVAKVWGLAGAFAAANFTPSFSDPDIGDTLQLVMITTLPQHGTLSFGGSAVVANQEMPLSQIASLLYSPTGDYNGPDTFAWKGSDGMLYSTAAANVNLAIDTVPPAVTVNSLVTKNNKPTLTGTVTDPDPSSGLAGVAVVVNGQHLTATVVGTTWSVVVPTALPDGTYNVQATATDNAANSGVDATTNELTVDTVSPVVTINSLTTKNNKPTLGGVVTDAAPSSGLAGVAVVVNGQHLTATVVGTTWSVAVPTSLPDGTYNVVVTATDNAGNSGVDATTNELVVDTVPPVVTVNSLVTKNNKPTLSGVVTDASPSSGVASVAVVVNGQHLTATMVGTTWSVAVPTALPDGTYNVQATATDNAANSGSDATTNELTVDTVSPAVTINARVAKNNRPTLIGTVTDASPSSGVASVAVVVNGQHLTATVVGTTWNAPVPTLLPDGTYNVVVTATDNAGNSGNDATTNELTIDVVLPVVTVNSLLTKNNKPTLSGTVTDASPSSGLAGVTVDVNGQHLTASVAGSTWSVAVPTSLADGTYNVVATATDKAANSGVDATTNELTIDTTAPAAPAITGINSDTGISPTDGITSDQTLVINGAAEANSTVTITRVGLGAIGTITTNGSGIWSFDYTGTTLPAGSYSFTAGATDAAGNTSISSSACNVTIDTMAPTVAITDISPDPRRTAVDSVIITFSEPVAGFDLGDLSLTRSGGANLLTASHTLISSDGGRTWTLGNLTSLTGTAGAYALALAATNSGVNDASSNALAMGDSDSWTVEDPDDQISEATAIAIGSMTTGNTIDAATDVDLYAVTVPAGWRLCFDIDRPGGTLDSYIRLFNSAGSQLAGSNNAPAPGEVASTESYLEYTFTSAGTYYLGVSGNGNCAYSIVSGGGDAAAGSTGAYTLIVSLDGDPDDTIPMANAAAVGSTITGNTIDVATDVDLYAVTVTAGQRLCFDIDKPSGTLDSYIRLFNSAGAQLAGSNNAPAPGEAATRDSYLEYTFASAGTYYLGVSGAGNSAYSVVSGNGDAAGSTGAYTLVVTLDDDPDDTIPGANPVAIGSTVTGNAIDIAPDVDLFSVTVTAGQRLCFDIDRLSGTLDSFIRLFNGAGAQLAGSNNAPAPGEAASFDSYLEYTFAAAGTYYLGVSGYGNSAYSIVSGSGDASYSTGAYTLIVTLDADPDDTIAAAIPIGANSTKSDSISTASDVDLFAFTVSAGQRLSFDIDRPSGTLDSYIRLFNSTGTQLAGSNNAPAPGEAATTDSYLAYTFATAGTYYLGVSAATNNAYSIVSGLGHSSGLTTGLYTLTLTLLP